MKHSYYLLILTVLFSVSCKELEEKLHPPVAKEATEITDESFTANWNGQEAHSYLLYVAKDADFHHPLPDYDGKEINGLSHQLHGLEAEHTYYYRVKAKYGDHLTDYSNVIEVTTSKYTLHAPVITGCVNVQHNRLTVQWEEMHDAEKYVLEVAYDEEFKEYVKGYERKVVTETHRDIYNLKERTTYYFRLRAVKGSTWSRYSDMLWCETPEDKFKLEKLVYKFKGGYAIQDNDSKLVYTNFYQGHQVVKTQAVYFEDNELALKFHTFYHYNQEGLLIKVIGKEIFRKDEFDLRLRRSTDPFIAKLIYNNKDQVTKIIIKTEEDTDVYTYSYQGDQQFSQARLVDGGIEEIKTFFLDTLGNIKRIGYSYIDLETNQEASGDPIINFIEYTYEDRKYPKGYNYMANNLGVAPFINRLPGSQFPIFHTQPCMFKSKEISGYLYTDEYIFKHEYNDCNVPLSRTIDDYYIESGWAPLNKEDDRMYYFYKGNPQCEEAEEVSLR